MTIKITTPNGGSDSLDFGCAQTPVVATVTGTEVSSGEGKLELKTTTGGTSATKATVLANGNLGIGTAAPALPVEVKCTARGIATSGTTPIGALRIGSPDNNIVLDTGITTGNYCYIQGTDKANLATGTNLLINPNGGNVGIGTSTPAAKLELATPASTMAEIRLTTNNTGSGAGDRGRLNVWTAKNDGTAFQAGYIDMDRSSGTETLSHMLFATNGGSGATERMRIDKDGKVGIGTTPETNLHVFKASSGAATDGSAVAHFENSGTTVLQISAGTSSDCHLAFGDSGNQNIGSIAYLNNGNHMVFRADNGEKMRITGAGNVGIGTSAPTQKLTTVGTASAGVLTPSLMVANSLASNDSVAGMAFHNRYDVNGTGFKAAIILDGDNNSDATGDLKFLNSNEANIANPATIASHTRLTITPDGRGLSQFTAKAWVNFNGRGTLAVRDSHNVSSVADNGGGMYTINFANAMANTNYSVVGSAGNSNSGAGHRIFMTGLALGSFAPAFATGSVRVCTPASDHTPYDADYIHAVVFGD